MRLGELVLLFLSDFQAAGNAISTVDGYRNTYNLWVKFSGNPHIETIQADDLDEFINDYLTTVYVPKRSSGCSDPLAKSSIVNHWSAIKSLFNWATETGKIIDRPDGDLAKPTPEYRKIHAVSKNESDRIISQLLTQINSPKESPDKILRAKTNLLIWLVLIDTGIRIGELSRLEVGDYRPVSGMLYVQPYGNTGRKTKSRSIPLSLAVQRFLDQFISSHCYAGKHAILIPSQDGKMLSRSSLYHRVVETGENAGISDIHPHRCRHTYVRNFLKNRKGTIDELCYYLGHSTPVMSEYYAEISIRDFHMSQD